MNRAPVDELLEQGKNALVALKYREQVAVYRAASISLQAAIKSAENGHAEALDDWLQDYGYLLKPDIVRDESLGSIATDLLTLSQAVSLNRSHSSAMQYSATGGLSVWGGAKSDSVKSAMQEQTQVVSDSDSPWSAMEIAAQDRLKHGDTIGDKIDDELLDDALLNEGDTRGVRTRLEQTSTSVVDASLEAAESVDASQLATDHPRADQPTRNAPGNLECDSTVVLDEIDEEVEIDESKATCLSGTLPTAISHWNWREWMAPPVWASVGVHTIAIGILSLFVIRQISEPVATSIVSATYEGERILTQTPMESLGPVTPEDLAEMTPPADVLEAMPLESLSSAALIGSQMGQLPSQTTDGVMLAGGLSQGLSSESLSRVTQAQAVSTGGSRQVSGAEFYGVKATGNLFVYVVDCSPSMRRENAFEAAKFEIARSLQSMKPSQRYYIYFFAKDIERMEAEAGVEEEAPLYATQENVKRTMQWLERTKIQREGRPPNDVLTEAIQLEPDGIFLLFDGDTRVDVARHLTQVNRSSDLLQPESAKAPIHVVHFFAEEFAGNMRQVASENQGTYRFIPRTASVNLRGRR